MAARKKLAQAVRSVLVSIWSEYRRNLRSRRSVFPRLEALEARQLLDARVICDINPLDNTYLSPGKAVGEIFYFVNSDAEHGHELWKADAATGQVALLKDIVPGPGSSNISAMTAVGNRLFFTANDGVHGQELWVSDGTTAGTSMVKDLYGGLQGANPANLTAWGDCVYFQAWSPAYGYHLFKSDGTAAGTDLLVRINPSNNSYPANMTVVGDTMFLSAQTALGYELWKTDGTAAGTVLVKDIATGATSSSPSNFVAAGSTLFFLADDGSSGRELWKSDGTAAGTVKVKELAAGSASPTLANFCSVGSRLFFTFADSQGNELWSSDGTEAGTQRVKDINPGAASSSPANLTQVGSTLYFSALDGSHGRELWKSDGTTAGTVLVKEVWAGSADPVFANFVRGNNKLYFTASDGTGTRLWKSDGTAAGTIFLQQSSCPGFPAPLGCDGGTLFFSAWSEYDGLWLARSDGTTAGTVRMQPVNAGGASSSPSAGVDLNGTLFFSANDGTNGLELWKSDGTPAGTALVKNIYPGSGSASISNLTVFNNQLFFTANNSTNGLELWKTDGTRAGTTLVKDIYAGAASSSPSNLTVVGNTLFFTATDAANGTELWKTDGTAAGTVLVKNITAGSGSSSITNPRAMGGKLYFALADAAAGNELWVSDGTAAGTQRVADIYPGSSSSNPSGLTAMGNTLYFTADNGVNGRELWKSDGTATGTVMVKDILSGSGNALAYPSTLAAINGTLYFAAINSGSNNELWKSDGTESGTVLVKDISPGSYPSNPGNLTNGNGTLYFTCWVGNDFELWKSDGTTAGTSRVKDVFPGSTGSSAGNIVVAGEDLYFFTANDGEHNVELWRTDGTEAGTELVQDIWAGSTASSPTGLTVSGGNLFFAATDGVWGRELWGVSLPDTCVTVRAQGPLLPRPGQSNSWTFSASGPTQGEISWSIDWGDGSEPSTGTGISISLSHVYSQANERYSLVATATDANGSFSTTQTVAALADRSGSITIERWSGISGSNVASLLADERYPQSPDHTAPLNSFEANSNIKDNYGQRVRGYITPPVSGLYTFWIASDNRSQLFLSDSDDPKGARRIAQVTGYTGQREWDVSAQQQSAPIYLEAGRRYYIEALHKEGSGTDGLAVAWSGPGISRSVIAGQYLERYVGLGDLSAPQDVQADGWWADAVEICWPDAVSDAEEFIIERSDDGTVFTEIGTVSADNYGSYVDTNLPPGTTFFYRVRARNIFETSDPSPAVSATTASLFVNTDTYVVKENDGVLLWISSNLQDYLSIRWDLDGDNVFGETGIDAARGDEWGDCVYFNSAGLDGPSEYTVYMRATPGGVSCTIPFIISVVDVLPLVAITGGETAVEGTPYTVQLSASDVAGDPVQSWIINWGDGAVDTLPGDSTSASHIFVNGSQSHVIRASVVNDDGVFPATKPLILETATYPVLAAGQPGVNMVLQNTSGDAVSVNLGINSIRFHGTTYTGANQLFVNSSGLLSFAEANNNWWEDLYNLPVAAIAPLWGYWNTYSSDNSSGVLYCFDDENQDGTADRLIVQWNRVSYWGNESFPQATFQAIVPLNTPADVDNDIIFNYVDVPEQYFEVAAVGHKGAGSYSGDYTLLAYHESPPQHPQGQGFAIRSEGGIRVEVLNAAPEAVNIQADSTNTYVVGVAQTFQGSAMDAGNDPLTYHWTLRHEGSLIVADQIGEVFTFIPTGIGNYELSLTASDDEGASSSYGTTFTVSELAPAAPSNLRVTAVSDTRVDLSWRDNSGNESGFVLERARDAGFTNERISFQLAANATSYSDQAVAANTKYYYRIRAGNSGGESANSAVATVTTLTVNAAPTVSVAAAAAVGSTSADLSVLGEDDGGEGHLVYTWTVLSKPQGAEDPIFSLNGVNAAKATTATFSQAGEYAFRVTITDERQASVSSEVTIEIAQAATRLVIAEEGTVIQAGTTQSLTALLVDQFGHAMPTQPTLTWSLGTGGVGSMDADGTYHAGTSAGVATATVSGDGWSSSATLRILPPATGGAAISDTPQPGMKRYRLDTGFVVDAFATFLPPATASYTRSAGSSSTAAAPWWDGNGIGHDVQRTYTETLNVNFERQTDGNWIYSEIFTVTLLTYMPSLAGGSGMEQTQTETDSYSFIASGNADYSTFTLTATGQRLLEGSGTWSGAAGDTVGNWNETATHSASISNTTDFVTGAMVSHGEQEGSSEYSFISAAPYSYSVRGGTVSGLISQGNTRTSSYHYNKLAGNYAEEAENSTSYLGSGGYSYEQDGESVTGTITETGGESRYVEHQIHSQRAGGGSPWITQGTAGSGSSHVGGSWSYDQHGSYSRALDGGTATGTTTAGGTESWDADFEWIETANGENWVISSGSGLTGGDSSSHWSYTGSGNWEKSDGSGSLDENGQGNSTSHYAILSGYADGQWVQLGGTGSGDTTSSGGFNTEQESDYNSTLEGGSVSGTTTSSSTDSWSSHYSWTNLLDASGEWKLMTGTGNSSGDSSQEWSYEGEGELASSGDGLQSEGTLSESGEGSSTNQYGIFSHVSGGEWVDSGSGSGSSSESGQWSVQTTGSYSRQIEGGSVNGTTTAGHGADWSSDYSWEYELGQDGDWRLTSGEGTDSGNSTQDWSYTGNGSYVLGDQEHPINGTISESGGGSSSAGYQVNATVVNGAWSKSGSNTGSSSEDGSWSEQITGSYGRSLDDAAKGITGALSGTTTAQRDITWNDSCEWEYSLNSAGNWVLSDGSGNSTGDDTTNWSWNGEGNYTRTDAQSSFNGTISESGYGSYGIGYDLTLSVSNGEWATQGTSDGTSTSGGTWGDHGTGSYQRDLSGTLGDVGDLSSGTVGGTTEVDAEVEWDNSYNWQSTLDAAGVWQLTSGSGASTGNDSTTWSYEGGGIYTITRPDGEFIGDISESGSGGTGGDFSITSRVEAGVWKDQGTRRGHSNDSGRYSDDGGGNYSYNLKDENNQVIGSVNGTSNAEVHQQWNTQYSWTQTLDANGKWVLSAGNGTSTGTGGCTWDYRGNGSYSIQDADSSFSATVNESGEGSESDGFNLSSSVENGQWKHNGTKTGGRTDKASWQISGSGNYEKDIDDVSLLGTTSGRWSDSHDHSINWTYTLQSDGSWKLTGGSGSYKGDNSTSWSREGSGSYERGQITGELSESRTLSSGDSYDLSLSVADGQWQKTGSGEGYWSEERDSTDESDRPYASSDGRIEGNVHIKDYQGTQQTAQWSQQLNSEGAWVLGDGSAENRAISERDWSYQGQGEYTHQSYSGTIQENASGHWSESRTIDYTLVEGQWVVEGSRGEGSSSGMGVYSDSGQGAYSYTIQGKMVDLGGTWGSASGLMNESISESWTENRSWSLQLEEDGSWVLSDGTGQLEGRRERQQDYQAQGQYPVAGGYEGHLHEEGHESFTNDYQFSDSVVEGAWVRTGSSERELKSEYHQSHGYEGSYTREVAGGRGLVEGTLSQGGTQDYSQVFNSTGTLDEEGNWSFTGQGQEQIGLTYHFGFAGSDEWDVSNSSSNDSDGGNEEYRWESHVENESFSKGSLSESGSESTSYQRTIWWNQGEDGIWRRTKLMTENHGEAEGEYEYAHDQGNSQENERFTEYFFPFEEWYSSSSTQSIRTQSQAQEDYSYSYDRQLTVDYHEDGTVTYEAWAQGGGEASGQASWIQDESWGYGETQGYGGGSWGWSGGESWHQENEDGYEYSESWSRREGPREGDEWWWPTFGGSASIPAESFEGNCHMEAEHRLHHEIFSDGESVYSEDEGGSFEGDRGTPYFASAYSISSHVPTWHLGGLWGGYGWEGGAGEGREVYWTQWLAGYGSSAGWLPGKEALSAAGEYPEHGAAMPGVGKTPVLRSWSMSAGLAGGSGDALSVAGVHINEAGGGMGDVVLPEGTPGVEEEDEDEGGEGGEEGGEGGEQGQGEGGEGEGGMQPMAGGQGQPAAQPTGGSGGASVVEHPDTTPPAVPPTQGQVRQKGFWENFWGGFIGYGLATALPEEDDLIFFFHKKGKEKAIQNQRKAAELAASYDQDSWGYSLGFWAPDTIGLLGATATTAITARGSAAAGRNMVPTQGGVNLYKWNKPQVPPPGGWRAGDRMLYLPDQGAPKLNWQQNAGRLRMMMRERVPIYDSYRDPISGKQIPAPNSFLNMERKLLESRGWRYNPETGAYHPPTNE